MRTVEEYTEILDSIRPELGNAVLMAVSKTRTLEEIDNLYRAGVRVFGENHVQEIVSKFTGYRPRGLKLHMIGHLQTNKVSKVVPLVDMIETIDSPRLLEKVNTEAGKAGKRMEILFEFNTSGEASKSGFNTEEGLFDCIGMSLGMDNVVPRGLMTVGPVPGANEPLLGANPQGANPQSAATREAFRYLKNLKEKCLQRFAHELKDFDILSMGMSSDWRIAVEEGSTQVRIGTAIFGERDYGQKGQEGKK